MSLLISGDLKLSKSQIIPAVIGEAWGGGYFAGYISHTADGNATHALIVAPRATGATGGGYTLTTNLVWAANANASDGVNYSSTLTGGTVTGSITGTTMTVTAVSSGKVRPGHTITGTTVALGTTVVSQISGTPNGIGDYTVSILQTVTSRTLTAGMSEFDGIANSTVFKDIDNTVGSGSTIFPAANFCEAFSIGGFSDWYLPARYELDIAYFNLKPSTAANNTNHGINAYSVPQRNSNNTASYPPQTALTAFNTTTEAFTTFFHWTSTEPISPSSGAWLIEFTDGLNLNGTGFKLSGIVRTRAFRRIAL